MSAEKKAAGETAASALPSSRLVNAIAFAWGFAEATLFFIVPDVLLTRIALTRGWRQTLHACLCCLGGALLGGATIWMLAHSGRAQTLTAIFDSLPGIPTAMIARAGEETARLGGAALFNAARTATPYKLYAMHAGILSHSLASFLVWSALARLGRFVISCAIAKLAGHFLVRRFPPKWLSWFHGSFWVLFYAIYFSTHRG